MLKEKEQKKISVVVPLYNEEDYIERCVDSILAQTYSNWELLLVDDGSTDRSPEICDAYAKKDDRIKVFHQENRGFSGSRNTGLKNATGTYLMFVDGDDDLKPRALEIAYENMEKYDLDLVIGSFNWLIFKGDEILSCEPTGPAEDYFFRVKDMPEAAPYMWGLSDYGGCIHYCVWNRLFRKSIIDDYHICFDENLSIFEDVQFIYTYYLYADKCMVSKEIFYDYYRIDGKDDVDEKPDVDMFRCAEENLVTVLKAGFKYNYPEEFQRQMYDRTYDLYIKVSGKIFMDSAGLTEEEKFHRIVCMTEGFAFRFFCKVYSPTNPFWQKMKDMLEAGDYKGIYHGWQAKLKEGVAHAGK